MRVSLQVFVGEEGREVERGRSARIGCLGSDAVKIAREFFDLFNCLFM
jgi:hypothetical protein